MRIQFAVLTLIAVLSAPPAAPRAQVAAPAGDAVLKPTNHPRLPTDPSELWLAPSRKATRTAAMNDFATAVKLEVDSDFARALPLLASAAVRQGTLGLYAIYYQGLAELRLGRPADARTTFRSLREMDPVGYLAEGVAVREAECDEALGDPAAALAVYERLAKTKTTAPEDILMRLGRTAKAAGNSIAATDAYSRVVYEFPFSDAATLASTELETLPIAPITAGSNRYQLELGRAERLFGSKRYTAARAAFDTLRGFAQGDDRELVNLRIAESDYFLKNARAARAGVQPYIEKASRQGEALFFYAIATRDLGDPEEYFRTIRRIVQDFPAQSWAEEALNNLATYYIVKSDDEAANAAFQELYEKFPAGRYAERAAWKLGWWAYKNGRYADTVRAFESAAAQFPRSDYRPSWLYWSARAHEELKEPQIARARYSLVATDYLNTYYGRLAVKHVDNRAPRVKPISDVQEPAAPAASGDEPEPAAPGPLPPNAAVIRALLALDLYDQAIDELRYAQKMWGDSSAIQATFGWIYNQRGDLRAGINAMKRAYPQYMAAGGERLPADLLKVLFPVNYWNLIRRYSAARNLDPYMIAALIAQESTFTADVRSAANAYGLMQLLPSTGRQYAKTLRLTKRFTMNLLTTAEPNINMGTAYFADLVRQFGGAHYALATYNAGPNRVARWISERPGVDREEFIDDIPFPETQGYVKKILGTAEDYRRLYGSDSLSADDNHNGVEAAVSHAAAPAPAKKASATRAPRKPAAKTPAKKKAASRRSKKAA